MSNFPPPPSPVTPGLPVKLYVRSNKGGVFEIFPYSTGKWSCPACGRWRVWESDMDATRIATYWKMESGNDKSFVIPEDGEGGFCHKWAPGHLWVLTRKCDGCSYYWLVHRRDYEEK